MGFWGGGWRFWGMKSIVRKGICWRRYGFLERFEGKGLMVGFGGGGDGG